MHHIRFTPGNHPSRARRALRLLALLPLLVGCETAELPSATPSEVLVATTDRTEYQLANGSAAVTVHLRNLGDHVVEVVGCPDPPAMLLERWTTGTWEPLQSPGTLCQGANLLRTVRIDPGAEFTGRITATTPGELRVRVFVGPPQLVGLSTTVTTRSFLVRS